ncbi:MAG: HAD family hydrolase [Roseivirga sp.]|nr:HAD family hydrolase [Roseivirga sp.]
MKISFDLDGTLIPLGENTFPVERKTAMQNTLKIEPLRVGTRAVFKALKMAGHEVGIYTTSFRSYRMIKFWLWSYGLKADFIINEQLAGPKLRQMNIGASKYPPAFNIDLHIDDLPGIALEGERYGFETLLVDNGLQNLEVVLSGISDFERRTPVSNLA